MCCPPPGSYCQLGTPQPICCTVPDTLLAPGVLSLTLSLAYEYVSYVLGHVLGLGHAQQRAHSISTTLAQPYSQPTRHVPFVCTCLCSMSSVRCVCSTTPTAATLPPRGCSTRGVGASLTPPSAWTVGQYARVDTFTPNTPQKACPNGYYAYLVGNK